MNIYRVKMLPVLGPSYEAYSYGGSKFGNQTVVDKVPPDMLHLIDAHWYHYPPLNPMWHGILGFVIGLLGFISVSGNGMVVYIFLSTKSLRTPSNLFVINLAISDFCMMFSMSPPMVRKTNFSLFALSFVEIVPFDCKNDIIPLRMSSQLKRVVIKLYKKYDSPV